MRSYRNIWLRYPTITNPKFALNGQSKRRNPSASVIVTNSANRPSELHADFDTPSSTDWLSLPGGHFHVRAILTQCDDNPHFFIKIEYRTIIKAASQRIIVQY